MSQRASLLVLTILLLGTAPLSGTMIDESSTSELPLDNAIQRIEISANPDSIRDLGESNIIEDLREFVVILLNPLSVYILRLD